MEVHLKPEQELFLQHRVLSGAYATRDEAVQAAVALLEERDSSGRPQQESRKSLAQIFAESPLRGIDLDLSRDKDVLRDLDL